MKNNPFLSFADDTPTFFSFSLVERYREIWIGISFLAMASSEAGSSGGYQVFLNFKGPNTGFVDLLFYDLVDAGIRVFREDDELRVGQMTGEKLLRAIDGSSIYIPIFSRTYVSSKWCLWELACIVDNVSMSEDKKSIIPIFLDVEPEDIELKTPLYSNDLLKHEEDCPVEVEEWRAALAEVGKIEGWNWKKDQSQGLMVKLVVEEVLQKLKLKQKLVTGHLVGLNDRMKDLTELLDVNHPAVRLIGIYGMGGIGKTTVAKVVFNKLSSHFEQCCCFLEDVRKSSSTKEGIIQLQKKLVSDIFGSRFAKEFEDSEQGMRRIETTLCTKRVLVVLDDVDEKQQIEYIIGKYPLHPGSRIIITTREKIILPIEGFTGEILQYEILKMDDAFALQLFSWHAFDRDFPPNDYQELSSEFVSITGQLPLAIVVTGSLLKGKDRAFWKEKLVRLRNVPEEDVLKKLEISYDGLDNNEKQIFLDIACFFNDEKTTHAFYVWDSCQFDAKIGINVLTERCLIKVLDSGKLWMHDELIVLGRQIVREDSFGDLGKQSRLWIAEDTLEIIKSKERKDKVQALEIDGLDDSIEITNEEFERLQNLRLLKLGNGSYAGDFARCRSKLRWISWHSPHQDFRADNMHLNHLVVFKLHKIAFTDDSKAWDLIKRAKNLKVLSLTKCHGITTVPDFSKCLGLERLTLAGCSRLKRIESFIGYLQSLIELEIEGCEGLTGLPEEVGALGKLERFSLWGCSGLRELPCSIGSLTSLRELDLTDVEIRELPNSIGELKSLRILRFPIKPPIKWDGQQLPSGPDRRLRSGISQLINIEELDLCGHNEIKGEIPVGFGNLSIPVRLLSLRFLRLDSARICGIPKTIIDLCPLERLSLWNYNAIKLRLPLSLSPLHLKSKSLLSFPDRSSLPNLVVLCLSDFSRLRKISNLITGGNSRHTGMPATLMLLPPEKDFRRHLDPKSLVQLLSSYCSWRNLSALKLYQCEVEAIPLESLPTLERLTSDGCKRLEKLSIPLELRKLRQAWVSRCPELVEIQVVGSRNSLESLRVSGCKALTRIGALSDLKNLEELVLHQCNVLTTVEGLHELKSIKYLVVEKCRSLRCSIDGSCRNIPADFLVEAQGRGDIIVKQGGKSFKRYGEEILLDTSNKLERGCPSFSRSSLLVARLAHLFARRPLFACCFFTPCRLPSEEKKKDEPRPQAADVENSDKNYAVAAVQKSMEDVKDEVRQQAADMETSDRNYTIAAVQNIDGIDDRVKEIIDLLEMEINDEVRIIGIYGVDGIGKTTLAKAVYNCISSCFDSCSFLTEVEETTIQPLQTKLIRDILERDCEDSSFDEKIDLFQDIFCELKVLIVVDDVKEQSHLYSIVGEKEQPRFGPGSRIIVTSQNREILKDYDPERACTYTVNALDDGQVFELFCKHAFRMRSSVPDYDGLANRIVNATDKLPLAVEVVGSFLQGKSIQEWEKMEKSMKQFMMESPKTVVGLEEILDICYKELDQQQKDIFLDLASFISCVDARIASYMWPTHPSSGCILVPLAKIGENNELQMHSSPRRLGKRILKPEGSGDPDGRKFYIQETGPKAISGEKGMESVEPLFVHFTAEDFRNMPDIRFLKLDNAKVSGNFAGAFASLRWLCWHRFPLEFDAFNFVLGELVILDLSWSKVTEYWGGWSIIKMEKLKVLNLTGCSDLLFSPDLSGCKHLEILILERCSRLVKLDPSIGRLESLVSLNLKFCSQLNGLPVELGHMTALKELFIEGTSVQQIPISIGNLKQLKILSGFKCFPLTHLPSSISYLPALSELSLDGAKITELPSSLGRLLKLRKLSLKDCRYLEELPDSIGEMRSLEELDLSATNISELPNSIRNLDSLKVLRMDYSFIQAFPGEVGGLTSLEELNASWCRSLKGAIPRDIKELHNLKSLILGHSGISSLPSEISTITGLHTLDLLQCNEIEVLPELPPSLISLRVSSKRMKVIPLLKGLKELEEMCLSDEDLKERQTLSEQPTPESNVKHALSMWFSRLWNLELFQTQRTDKRSFLISFPKLRKLELSLSQIIKLKFELTDIPQLKTLTLSGLSLKEVSALPKTLSVFKLYHSAIKEIEGLEGLKALKRLDISDCKIQNLKGIGQLTSLRSLILSDCNDLSSPDLSNLVSLKVLEIRRCKMIDQIEGLEKIASLEKLNISECPAENSKDDMGAAPQKN